MSVILELPSELENKLSQEAVRRGVSLKDYLLEILASRAPTSLPARSGAELVAYWRREGLLGSRSADVDSPVHARTLRGLAERRERP